MGSFGIMHIFVLLAVLAFWVGVAFLVVRLMKRRG
jgi:hypothetical protein